MGISPIKIMKKAYEQNVGDLETNIKEEKKLKKELNNLKDKLEVANSSEEEKLVRKIDSICQEFEELSKSMLEASEHFSRDLDQMKKAGKVRRGRGDMIDVYDKADLNDSDTYHKITKKLLNAYIIEKIMFNRI